MTTIADIQEGNYCENCDVNCIHFCHEADCCSFDTWIARIAVKVETTNPDKEVQYEYNGKSAHILTIENSGVLKIIENNMRD